MTQVHIIGAGLAGLSAAVALVQAGRQVTLHEAGPAAGGRCRSYLDRSLGVRIDNGNHMLLSGNLAAMAYLRQIGARDSLTGPGAPVFPFHELAEGKSWVVRPSAGRLPWWLFQRARRVPGTRIRDYLALLRLRRAPPDASVAQVLGDSGPLYGRLLEALAISALNTRPEAALASLLQPVVAETLLRGGAACHPLVARVGLSESFIDPAIAWLAARGAMLHTGQRVTGLHFGPHRRDGFDTTSGPVQLAAGAAAVLAVPPWVASDLVPGLLAPDAFESILNVHFLVDAPAGEAGFIGVLGGLTEWIFVRPGIVSITVSAANRIIDVPSEDLAASIWKEVAVVLNLSGPMPRMRVVKEKRATFAATAEQQQRRPPAKTAWPNLALAGDWVSTGLPATIEGAIRSGIAAMQQIQQP